MYKKAALALCVALAIVAPLSLTACGGGGSDPAALAKKECSACHGYDRVTSSSAKTAEDWEKIVSNMEGLGYKPSSPENRKAIVDYLASQSK